MVDGNLGKKKGEKKIGGGGEVDGREKVKMKGKMMKGE